jgi:hypothetical protein
MRWWWASDALVVGIRCAGGGHPMRCWWASDALLVGIRCAAGAHPDALLVGNNGSHTVFRCVVVGKRVLVVGKVATLWPARGR